MYNLYLVNPACSMERESERSVQVTIEDSLAASYGLAARCGIGNQLVAYAGSGKKPQQDVATTDGRVEAKLHIITWATEMFRPVCRKLLHESHDIFLSLQSEAKDAKENSQTFSASLEYCHKYRAVIQAAILDCLKLTEDTISEEEEEEYQSLRQLFAMIELIWHLCEIIFIETLPGGIVLQKLLDWIRWHFGDSVDKDASEIKSMSEEDVTLHPSYWPTVYSYILHGRLNEALRLLSLHPDRPLDVNQMFATLEGLLSRMPVFTSYGRQSQPEFVMKWSYWQKQCRQCLEHGLFESNPNLQIICEILCGEERAFSKLKDLCGTWYFMLVSKLLYSDPSVKVYDLQRHTQDSIDLYGGTLALQPLDSILLSVLEYDVYSVIKQSSANLGNWWFVAHLTDLLHHADQLEARQFSYGSNLREFLFLEYATSLMTHSSLWQIGVNYLDHCPVYGREYLKLYIERIPCQTEKKAEKIVRICEERGLDNEAKSICKVVGMSCLAHKRMGSALSWCIKSSDATFATFLADKFLTDYNMGEAEVRGHSDFDLIDHLGSSMLLSDRLTFLGKYREFQELYKGGNNWESGQLLLSLLSAGLTPKRFWMKLLSDALPLLDTTKKLVFTTDQTYDLLCCLEELTLTYSVQKHQSQGQKEAVEAKIKEIRLGLADNLARAITEEKTLISN